MATRTFGTPIVEFYGETLTTGTTITAVTIPPNVDEVMFNGAAAHRVQFAPRLMFCGKTADGGVTFTRYTPQVVDRSTSTYADLSALDTAANLDYWYIGSRHKFAGAVIDVGSVNSNASVMTGYYYKSDLTWANATITDGTASGGACIAVDGNVIWTPATDWIKCTTSPMSGLYVIRFQVSAALDAATTILGIALLPDVSTNPGGFFAASTDYVMSIDSVNSGALAATAGAGSTLNITWMKHARAG